MQQEQLAEGVLEWVHWRAGLADVESARPVRDPERSCLKTTTWSNQTKYKNKADRSRGTAAEVDGFAPHTLYTHVPIPVMLTPREAEKWWGSGNTAGSLVWTWTPSHGALPSSGFFWDYSTANGSPTKTKLAKASERACCTVEFMGQCHAVWPAFQKVRNQIQFPLTSFIKKKKSHGVPLILWFIKKKKSPWFTSK